MAFACDLTIAAAEASFVESFAKLGLIPDTSGTFFVPRLVGMQRATGMFFLAEKVSAATAKEWGLVWEVVPLVALHETALELAASFHPALALIDIGLPGMDGYEVCRRLRADPAMAAMALCALTGYTPSEGDRLRPQQAGFDHHYVKPVSVDTLLALMKSLG